MEAVKYTFEDKPNATYFKYSNCLRISMINVVHQTPSELVQSGHVPTETEMQVSNIVRINLGVYITLQEAIQLIANRPDRRKIENFSGRSCELLSSTRY